MGWVISGMGHFGSCSIFDSVRLWVGLLWVFASKLVVFILDVGSGMDSGCSVWVSGLGSVLPGLGEANNKIIGKYGEDQAHQFLIGLNDDLYSTLRSQISTLDLLLPLDKIFNMTHKKRIVRRL